MARARKDQFYEATWIMLEPRTPRSTGARGHTSARPLPTRFAGSTGISRANDVKDQPTNRGVTLVASACDYTNWPEVNGPPVVWVAATWLIGAATIGRRSGRAEHVRPKEYERRAVGFFDRKLLGDG
jgi:hypothetical protein